MGKQKQKSKAPEQMNEKCYLLKVVAEQNRERILDYDGDQDTVKIYCIVDGQFKTLHEVPDYIKGDGFGKYSLTVRYTLPIMPGTVIYPIYQMG